MISNKAQILLSQSVSQSVLTTPKKSSFSFFFFLTLTSILTFLFLFACSSVPKKTAQVQLIESGLYRNYQSEELLNPLKKTDVIYTQDTQAVMWVKLKDIEGNHTLRWDWISPDKNVYFKTQDFEINLDSKKHNLNTIYKISIE